MAQCKTGTKTLVLTKGGYWSHKQKVQSQHCTCGGHLLETEWVSGLSHGLTSTGPHLLYLRMRVTPHPPSPPTAVLASSHLGEQRRAWWRCLIFHQTCSFWTSTGLLSYRNPPISHPSHRSPTTRHHFVTPEDIHRRVRRAMTRCQGQTGSVLMF